MISPVAPHVPYKKANKRWAFDCTLPHNAINMDFATEKAAQGWIELHMEALHKKKNHG